MSTQIKDSQGNIIENLDIIGSEVLIDARVFTIPLQAVNAEIVLPCQNTNSVAVEVRGTFVGTIFVQYSIDGTTYDTAPVFNPVTEAFVAGITTVGKFLAHLPSGTNKVRAFMSAYTSGAANVSLRGSQGYNFVYSKPLPTLLCAAPASAAINLGLTATLPAGGAGLFHYITRIRISKYCGAALTPAAAPSVVTSTNIPSTPSFDFKTLGSQGDSEVIDLDFTGNPLKVLVANTNTTIVAPALAGAIWKIQAFYYLGA